MGADHQIHRTCLQILQRSFLLCRTAEAAEHIDIHRKIPKTPDGRLIMLLGKNGGRGKNRRLLPIQHAFHHRPESDLRFAEPHVSAKQAIHGHRRFHIRLDFSDTAKLIVCFRVGEIVLKFLLPGRIRRESIAHASLPGGVQLDQLPRHILGSFSGLSLGLLPGVGADFIQPHRGFLPAADIFTHLIQGCRRDEQHVRSQIGNFYIVLHSSIHPDLLHGKKPTDAVLLVDNQVAGA